MKKKISKAFSYLNKPLDWLISSHHPKPNPVSCKLPAQHPLTCFQLESVIHVYIVIGCL